MRRLTTFKLDNFDSYAPNPHNFESVFKDKLTPGRKGGNSIGNHIDSEEKDDINEYL